MSKSKKKARSTVGAVEQAKGKSNASAYSRNHCKRETGEKQPQNEKLSIFDLLLAGEANAVSRSELCTITGLCLRNLQTIVHEERCNGKLILTNTRTGGYYKPGNTEETMHFIRSMRRRAAEVTEVADAVERAMMDEAGQTRIGGV